MNTEEANNSHQNNIFKAASKKISDLLETLASELEDNLLVAWLVTKNTLTVVVMALFILSPMIVWPFLMNWPVPQCYIAYTLWIGWLVTACVLAAIVGYLREKSGEK